MKGSLLLFFIQLVTVISAVPINPKKLKGSKRSEDNTTVATSQLPFSTMNYNPKLAGPVTDIQVGQQNFSLIVSTSSSFTIVGTSKTFIASDSTDLGVDELLFEFSLNDTSAEILFATVSDNIILPGTGLEITNATFAAAIVVKPAAFSDTDGILGIGLNTTDPAGNVVPTIMDVAAAQGAIPEETLGLFFTFPKSLSPEDLVNTGLITYGGVDEDLFCGPLTFSPALENTTDWTVNSSQVSLGNTSLITNASLVLDSASLRSFLPQLAFDEYVKLSGASIDGQGRLHFTADQAKNLDDLIFEINGVSYKLPAQAQIFPSQINSLIGNYSPNDIIGVVGNGDSLPNSNSTFLLGQSFFSEFYTAFQTGDRTVGLAVSVNSTQGCPS